MLSQLKIRLYHNVLDSMLWTINTRQNICLSNDYRSLGDKGAGQLLIMVSYDLLKELQMRPFFVSIRGVIPKQLTPAQCHDKSIWRRIYQPSAIGRRALPCRLSGLDHRDGRRVPAIR